jgi:NADH-quinone oxidoreductase subunit C
MTEGADPAEAIAARLAAVGGSGSAVSEAFGQVTVDVPPAAWLRVVTEAREAGLGYFDWLSAVDEGDSDGRDLAVVCHLAEPSLATNLLIRTRLGGDPPALATITGVFRGASWHERETFEMFGVEFLGHPDLVPLLLPDGFGGRPLRKDFVLASRASRPWPGAKEPGESEENPNARRRTRTPGVPDRATWGPRPRPPEAQDADGHH